MNRNVAEVDGRRVAAHVEELAQQRNLGDERVLERRQKVVGRPGDD